MFFVEQKYSKRDRKWKTSTRTEREEPFTVAYFKPFRNFLGLCLLKGNFLNFQKVYIFIYKKSYLKLER